MLRDTYLLSSQALQPFVSFLLHRIRRGRANRRRAWVARAAGATEAVPANNASRQPPSSRLACLPVPYSACDPHFARRPTPVCSNVGGLDRLSEFEANAALQDALAAGGRSTPLRCSLHILPAPPPAQAPSGALPPRVHALARLRLRVEPGWPLALVVGEEMLAQYSSVMVLLLQVGGRRGALRLCK